MGDVYPAPYKMIVPARRQSTTGAIAYSWRALDVRDIEVIEGLPVTTRERTVVDLLCDEGDASLAANALGDALRGEFNVDASRLAELLAPYAKRLGRSLGDGAGALEYLMNTAEMDPVSEANRALDRVLASTTPLPGLDVFLTRMMTSMPALAARLPAAAPAAIDEAFR